MTYIEEMARFRRRSILEALSQAAATAYTLHEHALKALLADDLQAVGTAGLRSDLQWLHEQGLVYAKQPGGVWTATLTTSGGDVRRGLTANPGVASPETG